MQNWLDKSLPLAALIVCLVARVLVIFLTFLDVTVLITIEAGIDKKAVEEKLFDMKRNAVSDMKSDKDEAHWLMKMEEAALKDYKSKDISSNRFVP